MKVNKSAGIMFVNKLFKPHTLQTSNFSNTKPINV